jgi:D-glycero-alpha-D-manno-heptose-7-phosphate kinase
MEKKKLADGISNRQIDEWYAVARQHGAIGGKVLGAGGGGFLLLFAHPESFQDIMHALPDLKPVPFKFEPQGSKIIYIEENGDCT